MEIREFVMQKKNLTELQGACTQEVRLGESYLVWLGVSSKGRRLIQHA